MAAVRHHFAKRRKDVCALNSNYYLRYERDERVKYVSHLDFVRVFGRAIRRAHIPVAYSEGFNPHPLLGFALPLSVGYTSECEIIEITLSEEMAPEELKERLNDVLPDGIRILSAHEGKSNMKKLDILPLKKKCYRELSGGQQQRICIARALAVKPSVLLMDEPTSALDPISTSKIEDLMEELKKKYTIVVVTHNMQQALRVSDYTAFFLVGEMVEYGETKNLFTYPQDKRTEDYITGRFG